MAQQSDRIQTDDLDGLRLLALGRIPRCCNCPRFGALVEAHGRGNKTRGWLPDVPEHCTHQVCAPLVLRYECGGVIEPSTDGQIHHLRAS
jgi:hypothetical protein